VKHLITTLYGLALLLFLMPVTAPAQSTTYPLVGTWNLAFSKPGKPPNFIAVMTFHSGGTSTEFDTNGTNSSASPGESIALGVWSQTADRIYSFKEENVTYDSAGKLGALAVGVATLPLGEDMNTFTGAITLNFYDCSVAQCPGPLGAGPSVFQISATRF
jgi:hypothetical protein